MKKLLLIIVVLLTSIGVFSQPRSEQEAMRIARDFFAKSTKKKAPQLSVVPQQKLTQQIRKKISSTQKPPTQHSSCYIINDDANNRFVIVSADERLYEILGYSNNGAFSIEDAPDGLLYMLDEYDKQFSLFKAVGSNGMPMKEAKSTEPVEPLISTHWGQGNPYWLLCPQYGDAYCVSGCVATAMAQVMAYHQYPDYGQGGSISYKTGKLGISQYMNFESQHFEWNKMADTYIYYYDENGVRQNVPQRSDEENKEVAKLMHACGVSVFMDYNTSANGGSGADPSDISYALIHHFGYNPNIYYAEKDYYNRQTWDDLIISELNAKRPILYGGRGSLGGHRFVLDGVDSEGRYHFNFGWNGSSDGYFELDAIDPSIYNFSSKQSMILLVSKDVVGSPSDVFYSKNFTLSNSVKVGGTANAKFNPICHSSRTNSQTVSFSGEYGIGVFDKNWQFVKSLYSSSCTLKAGYCYTYNRDVDVRFDVSTFTENSQFYIALYAQSNGSIIPTPMRTSMGANDWYRATTKDGVVTLTLLGIISDDPVSTPEPDEPKTQPLTGNLKILALDKADEHKIWDVFVVQDGTDSKKYWFKGIDYIVSERGFTPEQNENTVYGIIKDDGTFSIPVPQKLGENLFLNNYSSEGDMTVTIAKDGSMMQINEKWGTVERKKSDENTTQENVSVYTAATFYPTVPNYPEAPIILVNENHMMTIACGTEEANIHFTFDGSTPTISSKIYTEPEHIDRNLTIKAIAIKDANSSEIAQLKVNDYVVPTPDITESDNKIYITCPNAEHIYFTTDGSIPTIGSKEYKEYLELSETTTIKAIGVHDGWKESEVAQYEYIVIPDLSEIVVSDNIKGQLASNIPIEKKLTTKSLTITGELDGTDITVIREMLVDGNLEYLNIKGCTIKAGGDKYPYLSLSYETEDNVIGRCMFAQANNLKAIILPDNTIKVSHSAFSDCNLLKEVSVPEECTEIDQAFTFCKNLEIVNLPNSLVLFAPNNFAYCPNITAINVGENNQSYKSVDGVLYSKDCKKLIRFANNKCSHYNIIDGTTEIGEYAFYCSNVENVVIPNSVVSIGRSAFYSSEKLLKTVLPNSIIEIGNSIFNGCSSLSSVTLSEQISTIEDYTFSFCTSLKSLYIPKNVCQIASTAFNYCSSLQLFEVDDANPYLMSDDGVIYSKDKNTLVRCPIALYSEDFKIGEGVETIADNAFMGCKNIQEFTLPMSVDSIGQHAFEDCSMSSIQLSDNVRFVGYQTFSSCDSLKTFVFPNSLKEIAESMFIFDYALSFIKIHGDITKISRSAFRFCRELSTIECAIKNIDEVEVGNLAFDGIPDDCTWYVPFGTEKKYKACNWWVPTWKIIPHHENLLVTSTVSVSPEQTTMLPIELINDDDIRLLEFELRLPEGVSVLNNEDDYAIDLTDRASDSHTQECTKQPNGNYKIVVSTTTLNNLSGNEGIFANITLKADDSMEKGEYEAYLSNIEITAVDKDGSLKAIHPNDVPFNVDIPLPIIIGDANGDGRISITDAVFIVNHILGYPSNTFNIQAADVNGDEKITITDAVQVVNIILNQKE